MRFVAEKTSIPVPRVHCAFVYKNRAVIVMERIQGQSFGAAWKHLSDDEREDILIQLRVLLQELRSLPPPPGVGIESCVGGSLRDSRIPQSWPRYGPFKTTQEFHRWLRHGFCPDDHPGHEDEQDWKDLRQMVALQDRPWPAPVFTHGDLNPSNIMIRGNKVSGIIDWEFAGWYPYYWEYTSAWYGGLLRPTWQAAVDKFLDPHPDELAMEITRQKWWGG